VGLVEVVGLGQGERRKSEVSTFDVLRYIRSTFDDEEVLGFGTA
jgi:hypothetical protein